MSQVLTATAFMGLDSGLSLRASLEQTMPADVAMANDSESPDQRRAAWMAAAPGDAQAAAWKAFDTHAQSVASWWGVKNISAALFGLPVGFLTIIIVSLLTPAPSRRVQDMVDATRRPAGDLIMQDKGAGGMVGGH